MHGPPTAGAAGGSSSSPASPAAAPSASGGGAQQQQQLQKTVFGHVLRPPPKKDNKGRELWFYSESPDWLLSTVVGRHTIGYSRERALSVRCCIRVSSWLGLSSPVGAACSVFQQQSIDLCTGRGACIYLSLSPSSPTGPQEREYLRLFGFPDWFRVAGKTFEKRMRQIGNLVAFPIGRAIGQARSQSSSCMWAWPVSPSLCQAVPWHLEDC